MSDAARILIVEDEQHLADGLQFNLEAEGYATEVVDTGEAALERLIGPARERFDLVVLDVMLPGKDGFAVVGRAARARQFVPVLMLTARGRPEDVLKGFAAGADDYLPKPTELAILIARDRRPAAPQPSGRSARPRDQFTFAGKTIDFDALELRVGERALPLTLMEANLLRYLIQHEGQGGVAQGDARRRLGRARGHRHPRDRQLHRPPAPVHRDDPARPQHLLTVRGVGYRFIAEPGHGGDSTDETAVNDTAETPKNTNHWGTQKNT